MKRQQNGFAPQVIIMAVLGLVVVALIAVTVYYFLDKNKTDNKAVVVKDNTDKIVEEVKNKTFENNLYTFDYPGVGWSVRTDGDDVTIDTPDFEADSTSVIKGASVTLVRAVGNLSVEQAKKNMQAKSIISEYDTFTIDGQSAYEFRCSEYCNRQILLYKNGKGYEIKLNSFNDDQYPAYDLLITSLKIK